jgi:excisionase family DNA binding protein
MGVYYLIMEIEIQPNKIYTPKEARDFLKVSESTMKRMLKNGIIKAYKVSGQYRIWGSEILILVSPELESGVYKVYKKIREKTHDTIKKW